MINTVRSRDVAGFYYYISAGELRKVTDKELLSLQTNDSLIEDSLNAIDVLDGLAIR